ncbi:MAG: hypothetical protein HW389_3851 [Bacteroidetes bacterium]|nr:hypothetical protein [Bacteroidota bacterium]
MATPNHNDHASPRTGSTEIEKDYAEIIQRGKEQQPGINELLELYGEFQMGFKLSQEYLQLTQPIVYSSTSNTSSPALLTI